MSCQNSLEIVLAVTEDNKHVALTAKSKSTEDNSNEKTITLAQLLNAVLKSGKKDFKIALEKISLLDLSNCQLTELPTSLENLNLKFLNMKHNKLTSVPVCVFTGLKGLEYLDLGHNLIKTFDMPPRCVVQLKTLKINNNLLENIPQWITSFQSVNLEELNFSFNRATNYDYKKNSYNLHFMKVKKLKLRNSRLVDGDFNFLRCFGKLEYLDISNKQDKFANKFDDADDLFVRLKWKQLKVLKMNDLELSLFPEGIPWIETLTELHISQNSISWFPVGIEFMVNLQVLDVSQNHLIAIPEQITKLELLEVLLASHNRIEVCPDFNKMPSLKILDLYDNILESVSLNCDTLDCMDLDQNYFDTKEFSDYGTKKLKLREFVRKSDLRSDKQKIKQDPVYESDDDETYFQRHRRSIEDIYEYSYDVGAANNNNIVEEEEEEDWDSPQEAPIKNPEIDSADEAWDGEEKKNINKTATVRKKVYVEDEDWMFEDVEDLL